MAGDGHGATFSPGGLTLAHTCSSLPQADRRGAVLDCGQGGWDPGPADHSPGPVPPRHPHVHLWEHPCAGGPALHPAA